MAIDITKKSGFIPVNQPVKQYKTAYYKNNKKETHVMPILLIVLLVVALIIAGPLLTIWALNTIFPILAIPYDLSTWAAIIILGMFLKPNVSVNKK